MCVSWLNSFICAPWLMEDGAYTKSALSQAAGLAEVLSVSWLGPSWMLCVEWLIRMWAMTQTYTLHDSYICVSWLPDMCAMTHPYLWQDSFYFSCSNRSNINHMRSMTHSHACHDSFIRRPRLIHTYAMTHSYACHDSFTCVPFLFHMLAEAPKYPNVKIFAWFRVSRTWQHRDIRMFSSSRIPDNTTECNRVGPGMANFLRRVHSGSEGNMEVLKWWTRFFDVFGRIFKDFGRNFE